MKNSPLYDLRFRRRNASRTSRDYSRAVLLLCRKDRSDISGITRKSTAENIIGGADFLISGVVLFR